MFDSTINILLVAFAFGFVIFWHELGHFLAARWAGVRVEQFAVGMGQALVSWRKGIGFKYAGFGKNGFHWGSTQEEFDRRVDVEFARRQGDLSAQEQRKELSFRERYDIAKDLGIGETEYRISWVPLGGYVKPTGQDDLRPAAEVGADDPHAFGAKSVGKRMVIISAGVIMNVILAFVLYVVLFMHGFNSAPTVIGSVFPGSPAQKAGLQVGDRILSINGDAQEDYTKITMNVALLRDDAPAEFVVRRPGAAEPINLRIQPVKTPASYNMPAIGVTPSPTLVGGKSKDRESLLNPANDALPPGARITQINGQDVGEKDYHKLDQAVQTSAGKPVTLTIVDAEGARSAYSFTPGLSLSGFGQSELSIAGLQPRVLISGVKKESPAQLADVRAGDVVQQLAIVETADALRPPSAQQFLKWINDAGQHGQTVRLTLVRKGETLAPKDLRPIDGADRGRKVIGVTPAFETERAVVGNVIPGSPADKAGLQNGDQLTAVNDAPMTSWFDVIRALRTQKSGEAKINLETSSGPRSVTLQLGNDDQSMLADIRYTHALPLESLIEPRQTSNPITAARWGVTETKFSIIQVYLTLQRLFQGSVPVSNLSGPLGIFSAGSSAAERGFDYLIWFTALISANLAVVNFLPIPIVDGGLFVFLLSEKITGKPPSPRVQTVAQVIGLVLLGGLFLFVTYHDVVRIWG